MAIGTTRNEADIIRVNVLHHLAQGIDHPLLIDNGWDDGTVDVLNEMAHSMPVEWSSHVGHFRQKDLLTNLARQALVRGADWVIPIDADEFWDTRDPVSGRCSKRRAREACRCRWSISSSTAVK
jgi:hypothetical protein